MDNDLNFKDGDKIELYKTEQNRYKAVITEVINEKLILVPIPTAKLSPMQIKERDIVFVAYFRDRGRYVVETIAKDFVKRDDLIFVVLEQVRPPVAKQLREFFRVPVDVKVRVFKLVPRESDPPDTIPDEYGSIEMETVGARDLSVTGLSIESSFEYKTGDKFMMIMHFNDKRTQIPPLTVFTEAMRVEADHVKEKYKVGMKFVGLTDTMSDQLAKYLLAVQQKQIIRKRLIEGK